MDFARIGSSLSIFLYTAALFAYFEAVYLGEIQLPTMRLALTRARGGDAIIWARPLKEKRNE
jgi:hypothetical protein